QFSINPCALRVNSQFSCNLQYPASCLRNQSSSTLAPHPQVSYGSSYRFWRRSTKWPGKRHRLNPGVQAFGTLRYAFSCSSAIWSGENTKRLDPLTKAFCTISINLFGTFTPWPGTNIMCNLDPCLQAGCAFSYTFSSATSIWPGKRPESESRHGCQ
ncbi:hypothetical protein DM02DRAFT_682108, partial [Periconia macrospinosa]